MDRLAQVPPVLESLRMERFLTKLARRRDGFARRDLTLATLLYGMGLRSCEVVELTVSDADLVSETLAVRHRQGFVPLLAEVSAALTAYLAERGTVPPEAPRRPTYATSCTIGTDGSGSRCGRTRCATPARAIQRGVSIEATRGLLGHAGL